MLVVTGSRWHGVAYDVEWSNVVFYFIVLCLPLRDHAHQFCATADE